MPYKDPEKAKQWAKEYRKKHGERIAVGIKLWRERNPEYIKKDYIKNREYYLKRERIYYIKHRDKKLAAAKQYAKNNPHIGIKRYAARRLRIGATVESKSAIVDFIKLIRNSKWVHCYYCKKRVPGKEAHIDHMVPLARGGSHRPDNICASCSHCNLTKHAKLISEWKRQGQQILSL